MGLTWEDIMWEPGRYSCRFCSSRKGGEKPADYDVWFEVMGWLLEEGRDQGPHYLLMPLCADCTATERERPDDEVMPIRLVRSLKS